MATFNIDLAQFQMFLLVFIRVGAIMMSAPILGRKNIPVVFKAGLALSVSIILLPILNLEPFPYLSEAIPFSIGVVSEIMLGIIIGLSVNMIFAGIQLAGQLTGYQMGFAIANVMDPLTGSQSSIFAGLLNGDNSGAVDDGRGHVKEDLNDEVLELTEAQKRVIGLSLVQAGPGSLYNELSLMGEIRLNEDRVAHVVPKVPGVVLSVAASLGNEVKIGQILATIESAELAESKADYLEKLRQLEIAKKAYKRKKYFNPELCGSRS